MLGEARCLKLLDAALAACDADQAEAILVTTTSALTRFAESVIHQNVAERDTMVSVRAVVGKRIGCARGNQRTKRQVEAVAHRALDLARVSAENEQFVSLPSPQPIERVECFAKATAASDPEHRAEAARAVVEVAAASRCRASGSLSAESVEIAVANSLGVRAYAPATEASLVTVIADDDSSGYAEWHGIDIAKLDAVEIADIATGKFVEGRGAEPIDPGEYTVILEPLAVGDMLSLLAYVGLGALALQEGRSFLTGRIGDKVMGDNITLWDDATDPRGLAFPFDWEGVPHEKVPIIENGVARGVAYDSYTANKEGKQSTGHAFPAPNTYGPMPTNLFLAPGEATLEEMIASTTRGILVTRFHYTNIVHEKQTTITGMTRDGTFLIENGRLIRPLKNLRFTQSIVEALSNVELIGRDCELVPHAYAPPLKISSFAFTS